LKFCEVHCSNN